MLIDNVAGVHIENNVMFWARKFIVYVEEVIANYTFIDNLLIGAKKRD